jgi:hypothetical protein
MKSSPDGLLGLVVATLRPLHPRGRTAHTDNTYDAQSTIVYTSEQLRHHGTPTPTGTLTEEEMGESEDYNAQSRQPADLRGIRLRDIHRRRSLHTRRVRQQRRWARWASSRAITHRLDARRRTKQPDHPRQLHPAAPPWLHVCRQRVNSR